MPQDIDATRPSLKPNSSTPRYRHVVTLAPMHAFTRNLPLLPRAVVEAVMLSEGTIGSADDVARHLGLSNRFSVARLLKHEGLPPMHRLARWVMIGSWLCNAKQKGLSLRQLAFRSHRHPSACYRLVKELTGLGWGELQQHGLEWFQNEFVRELKARRAVSLVEPDIGLEKWTCSRNPNSRPPLWR